MSIRPFAATMNLSPRTTPYSLSPPTFDVYSCVSRPLIVSMRSEPALSSR